MKMTVIRVAIANSKKILVEPWEQLCIERIKGNDIAAECLSTCKFLSWQENYSQKSIGLEVLST